MYESVIMNNKELFQWYWFQSDAAQDILLKREAVYHTMRLVYQAARYIISAS
jgi:hypothetical protein